MRGAAVAGGRYSVSCLGCSGALMVAMVLIGMSSLWWTVVLSIVVLIYKVAPPLHMRDELVLSLVIVALGVVYVQMACVARQARGPARPLARRSRRKMGMASS